MKKHIEPKDRKINKMFSLSVETVELIEQLVALDKTANNSSIAEEAIKNLAKEKGLWSDLNDL
jgi:hypothetical protein